MTVMRSKARAVRMLLLIVLLVFLGTESHFHFDRERIALKFKNNSDQRHWNFFYGQSYVFKHSAIRYDDEFKQMRSLLKPNSLLLSDLSTSYYAAAYLPVWVVNIHRHHGRLKHRNWNQFLNQRSLCYLDQADHRQRVTEFMANNPEAIYILVNKDVRNKNLRQDCLAIRSKALTEQLPDLADLLWEGEYLNLYALK